MKNVAVLVTTSHRGVFFGYRPAAEADLIPSDHTVRLTDARIIIYWSPGTHGVLGLASTGPADGSRISAPVPAITLTDVTSVSICSATATERMESTQWV